MCRLSLRGGFRLSGVYVGGTVWCVCGGGVVWVCGFVCGFVCVGVGVGYHYVEGFAFQVCMWVEVYGVCDK